MLRRRQLPPAIACKKRRIPCVVHDPQRVSYPQWIVCAGYRQDRRHELRSLDGFSYFVNFFTKRLQKENPCCAPWISADFTGSRGRRGEPLPKIQAGCSSTAFDCASKTCRRQIFLREFYTITAVPASKVIADIVSHIQDIFPPIERMSPSKMNICGKISACFQGLSEVLPTPFVPLKVVEPRLNSLKTFYSHHDSGFHQAVFPSPLLSALL